MESSCYISEFSLLPFVELESLNSFDLTISSSARRDSKIRPQNSYQKSIVTLDPYHELLQTSRTECFAVILSSYNPLTIIAKRSIFDIWEGPGYSPGF